MGRKRPHRKHITARRHAAPTVVDAASSGGSSALFAAYRSRPWYTLLEWSRGKAELAWENALHPALLWLASLPARLGGGRRRTVRLGRGRRVRLGLAWSWGDQGVGMLKQTTRVVLLLGVSVAVLVLFFAFALRMANAFAGISAPSSPLSVATDTPDTSITIRNVSGAVGTIAPMPTYTLGMWPDDYNPKAGSQVRVYARVSDASQPAPNLVVTITVLGQNYTVMTDADGLAIFTIPANGAPDHPVTVYGFVAPGDGSTLTATTSYTPV